MKETMKRFAVSERDLEAYCQKTWAISLKEKLEERRIEWILKLLSTVREEKETERQIMENRV